MKTSSLRYDPWKWRRGAQDWCAKRLAILRQVNDSFQGAEWLLCLQRQSITRLFKPGYRRVIQARGQSHQSIKHSSWKRCFMIRTQPSMTKSRVLGSVSTRTFSLTQLGIPLVSRDRSPRSGVSRFPNQLPTTKRFLWLNSTEHLHLLGRDLTREVFVSHVQIG